MGMLEQVSDAAQLASRLKQAPAFVAIKAAEIGALPVGLMGMLEPVSERGHFVLFSTLALRPARLAAEPGPGDAASL